MKFKKLASLILVSALMLTFTACASNDKDKSSGGKSGGTVVIPMASDPDIINGAFANVKEDSLASNIVYAPLYTYEKGNLVNYLAEKVDFKDSKELTIKLKSNLKWHDGKPITAEDVLFTFNTVLDEKQNSPSRQYLLVGEKPVKVEKIDDLTVKITLPTASESFLYGISKISPIPKHVFEGESNIAKSEKNNNPVGSGPFKFKEWKKGESIVFEKNTDYFGGYPKADSIALKIIPNEASQEAALNNGEISLMKTSAEGYEKAKSNSNLQTYTYSEERLNYIVFNQNISNMANKEVRQALSYALNRNEMIESAYGKEGSVPAKSILVPEADFYTEEGVEGYDQDTNKAKDLLDKSGIKIDKLKIGYNTGRFGHKNYALVAQQELKKIGIEAEIVPYESKAFFNILFSNSTECDMYVNGYAWGLEPNPYRGMFETGQYCNQTKYSNAEIDALWEKGFTELNKEKREEIYKQIQQDISKDAPIYTIDYEQNLMAAQKNLKGIKDAKPSPAILFEDWSKLYVE
ncbi:oligopeptide ABC transporter substrate-binding protein [Clostridioides difficile]|uniref:ABC transporter substrate-binding protein n=1 Tax=Clostridioides difficile TaxID=1496 RepID=UPI000D68EAE7|nr:ABC transporter substrate-binding protein [Clostridioides difficile]VHY51575.1 oligopeptide ABC transporter substrate-binding protein [Clostridioides difficile]